MGALEEGVDPYQPPPEAALLSAREREAVDEISRLLIQARRRPMKLGEGRLGETRLGDEIGTYVDQAEAKRAAFEQGDYDLAARERDSEGEGE